MKVTVRLNPTVTAVVNFGVNWLYHHYLNVTGKDLLVEGIAEVGTSKTFETCADLYYAGYLAECSMNKEEPIVTREMFVDWIMSLPPLEVGGWLRKYFETLSPPKTGEVQPNRKKKEAR